VVLHLAILLRRPCPQVTILFRIVSLVRFGSFSLTPPIRCSKSPTPGRIPNLRVLEDLNTLTPPLPCSKTQMLPGFRIYEFGGLRHPHPIPTMLEIANATPDFESTCSGGVIHPHPCTKTPAPARNSSLQSCWTQTPAPPTFLWMTYRAPPLSCWKTPMLTQNSSRRGLDDHPTLARRHQHRTQPNFRLRTLITHLLLENANADPNLSLCSPELSLDSANNRYRLSARNVSKILLQPEDLRDIIDAERPFRRCHSQLALPCMIS